MLISTRNYLAKLRMTHLPTIIVEGPTDRFAVGKLVEAHLAPSTNIRIEDPSNVQDPSVQGLSKRQLLEVLAAKLSQHDSPRNLIHILVDREFRDTSPAGDRISHLDPEVIDGCLYWTWGHSIENYLMEEPLCVEYFTQELTGECKTLAIQLLRNSHDAMLQAAFAVTKTLWSENNPNAYAGSLGHRCFSENNGSLVFDMDRWRVELKGQKHQPETIAHLLSNFSRIFEREDPSLTEAQWNSHGHIAFKLQAGLLNAILTALSGEYWDAKQIARRSENEVLMGIVKAWISCVDDQNIRFPKELIRSIASSSP